VRNYSLGGGFIIQATNPDGKLVGWVPPIYANNDKTIESGAILIMDFLGSYRGLLHETRVTYAGYASTAEVTLV
jgi:hypothetical protein